MPPNFSICGTYIRSTLFLSFPDRQQRERLPLLASMMAEEEEFTGQSEAADAKEPGTPCFGHLPPEEPSAAPQALLAVAVELQGLS